MKSTKPEQPVAYIFGYGSLVDPDDLMLKEYQLNPIYGFLENHERHWNIAIKNMLPELDSKHHIHRTTKERFPGYVSSLALSYKEGTRCNGIVFAVTQELYDLIAIRETNIYNRSDDIRKYFSENLKLDIPLYTYLASELGHKNYSAGKASSIAVPQEYYDIVEAAFRARSSQALADYNKYTIHPEEEFEDLVLYRV